MKKLLLVALLAATFANADAICDTYQSNAAASIQKASAELDYGSPKVAKMYALDAYKNSINARNFCNGENSENINAAIKLSKRMLEILKSKGY